MICTKVIVSHRILSSYQTYGKYTFCGFRSHLLLTIGSTKGRFQGMSILNTQHQNLFPRDSSTKIHQSILHRTYLVLEDGKHTSYCMDSFIDIAQSLSWEIARRKFYIYFPDVYSLFVYNLVAVRGGSEWTETQQRTVSPIYYWCS